MPASVRCIVETDYLAFRVNIACHCTDTTGEPQFDWRAVRWAHVSPGNVVHRFGSEYRNAGITNSVYKQEF